jgi:hypothetical protein
MYPTQGAGCKPEFLANSHINSAKNASNNLLILIWSPLILDPGFAPAASSTMADLLQHASISGLQGRRRGTHPQDGRWWLRQTYFNL